MLPTENEALRVLLVANTLPPEDLSGAGEQVVQLAAGLLERGVDVRLLGRGEHGVRGKKMLFPLGVAKQGLAAIKEFAPHVVQVHESDAGLLVRKLARQAPSSGRTPPLRVALQQVSYVREREAVRTLVDAQDGRVLGRPVLSERRFRRYRTPPQIVLGKMSARYADLVFVPSEQTGREVRADYGIEVTHVLPNVSGATREALAQLQHWNGASLGLAKEPANGPAAAAQQDATDSPMLFVGRLRIRKGVEVLLHALARQEARDCRLMIAGDGERRQTLEQLTRELGLESRVEFLGRCSRKQVGVLLKACRALVVPSTYEGMPLVILEAMERGTPVIASAVSGIPEVVVDKSTGWLVPPLQVAPLAATLDEAFHQPKEATSRGAAGLLRLEQQFRPDHAADRWLELVRNRFERPKAAALVTG